ncbi:MAG: glucosaminidase domain-containing protein [Clostridia bacterium]|nr:glucosaminidase domain-containing protein [Clostridia bacterium]
MKYTDESFLTALKPFVMADMKSSGILASLTAAQAFIESNKGNSGLTLQANNLFGIKGKYNGNSVKMWTTEYINGSPTRVLADFRAYPTWAESIADHSSLFNRLKRYENLRGLKDYILACKYVKADGYATSPSYDTTLLNCINKYKLYLWDAEVEGSSPGPSTVKNLPVLKRGSRGDYVKSWQNFLNLNGFFCGLADGIFGPNTENAVKEYQASRGLDPDGIIGRQTWASIGL